MADPFGWREVFRWLWENRGEIGSWLKTIFERFRGELPQPGGPGILVIGPGGTGKSTLGKLLTGDASFLIDESGEYVESWNPETYELHQPAAEVVVLPGQEHRRGASWDAVLGEVTAGKYRGVILVSAYGHHSFGAQRYRDLGMGNNKEEFLDRYLPGRIGDELAVLKKLAPFLSASPQKLWLLSVVTKQDLWWPKEGEVVRHYQSGEYDAAVRPVSGRKGEQGFRHETAFCSLIIRNFETKAGELLVPNAPGYDHHKYVDSMKKLFRAVHSLIEWENQS